MGRGALLLLLLLHLLLLLLLLQSRAALPAVQRGWSWLLLCWCSRGLWAVALQRSCRRCWPLQMALWLWRCLRQCRPTQQTCCSVQILQQLQLQLHWQQLLWTAAA
jgi:hypothetical protein